MVGILGYGEIGQALAKFFSDPKIKDLDRNDGLKGVNILHVCIPYTNDFVEIVLNEIKYIVPGLVIIHSTTAPKTTQTIQALAPNRTYVVHNPIRGFHPFLYKSMKTFVSYVGTDYPRGGELAKQHLESIGWNVKILDDSITTEVGKLLSTTYYALCIAWHGEMEHICKKMRIDFDDVVTGFNMTYNDGYSKLGNPDVVRPILRPPGKEIGGHCLIRNADILNSSFKSEALDLILKYGPAQRTRTREEGE